MVRKFAFGYALLFAWVTASGYIPAFITYDNGVRTQFGLFQLTMIDDITHGFTAIAFLIASLRSRKLSLLFLVTFGSYYILDAIFYLLNGFFNDKTLIQNLLLNAPHVGIGVTMLGIVYWYAPREKNPPA